MMLDRYSLPVMRNIWSPHETFVRWLAVEQAALSAMVKHRCFSADQEVAQRVLKKMEQMNWRGATESIAEIEKTTRHDFIAFLTYLENQLGPDARVLHRGLTTSDVVDTALSLALVRSLDVINVAQSNLIAVLDKKSLQYRDVPCIGRTHGQAAEPMSFGIKWAIHAAGIRRDQKRIQQAREIISVGKLSGAVGGFTHVTSVVEATVMEELGLRAEPVSNQVVQRDRHAELFCLMAIAGTGLERLATEIRHLSRTEVGEVSELFQDGQKGSSAMPHKHNPVLSENVTGLSRLLRGYAVAALEDVALWHERDISHSSVERIIAPDACAILYFATDRMATVVDQLVVNTDRIAANLLDATLVIHSQKILLMLAECGMPRQEAYEAVQHVAQESVTSKESFLDLVLRNVKLREHLPSEFYVRSACQNASYLHGTDLILERSKLSY